MRSMAAPSATHFTEVLRNVVCNLEVAHQRAYDRSLASRDEVNAALDRWREKHGKVGQAIDVYDALCGDRDCANAWSRHRLFKDIEAEMHTALSSIRSCIQSGGS